MILTEQGENDENLFELDARDIVLFKRHPEATSARNLLACRVTDIFGVNNRVGVELALWRPNGWWPRSSRNRCVNWGLNGGLRWWL